MITCDRLDYKYLAPRVKGGEIIMTITKNNTCSFITSKIERLFDGYTHNINVNIDELNKTVCFNGAQNTIMNFYKFNCEKIDQIKSFGFNVTYVFIG